MDKQEEMQFLEKAMATIQKLSQWSDERIASGSGATPEELALLAQIKVRLQQLKDITKERP